MSVRTPPSPPKINGAENRHTMKIKPDVKVVIYTKMSSSWKCELTFDKIGLAELSGQFTRTVTQE